MQITITQPQIEEAIKNYVLSMLTLKPGQELAIDLRATRGDAGYTAEIAVGPAGKTQAAAPVARTTSVRNTGAGTAQPAAQVETAEPETDDTPEPEGNVEDASAESAAEEAPAEADETTGAKRPSIFANMKAPKGRVGQEVEPA